MPTREQLQMWAEEVATAAAPFGEAASVAIGMPDITCAYLINLLNRLLLKIAQDTALTGMTGQEAQAYKDLQVLRSRIIRACDPTQTPEPPEEAEPATDDPDEPVEPLDTDDPVDLEPPPPPIKPEPPEPAEQAPSCCDIHGHQLPGLDFRGLSLRARSGGVVIGGAVVSDHPCGFRYWDLKVVLVGANGTRTEIYRTTSRVGSPSERLSIAIPSSLVRGFRSGYVEVTVESSCGTSNRAVRSNHGWVIKPGSPTIP